MILLYLREYREEWWKEQPITDSVISLRDSDNGLPVSQSEFMQLCDEAHVLEDGS